MGREPQPGPQHGGVQAALPLAVSPQTRASKMRVARNLAPRIFLKLAVLPRKDSCCRTHERLISHVRAVCENPAAVHKTCPGSPLLAWIHILSFFPQPRARPLVAASHTHLLPSLCPLSPQSVAGCPIGRRVPDLVHHKKSARGLDTPETRSLRAPHWGRLHHTRAVWLVIECEPAAWGGRAEAWPPPPPPSSSLASP